MASLETFPGQSRSSPTTPSDAHTVPTPLTASAVLSSFSSSPSPHMAALEHVVSDRNMLASQNSQLWKLIEKQRAGYSQILKELERVRTERDIYKVRLQTLGDNPDQVLKKYKSKSKQSSSSLKTSSSHSGLRNDEQASTSDARLGVTKPHFEDSAFHNLPSQSQSSKQESTSSQSSLLPVVGPKRTESLQLISGVPIPPSLRVGFHGGSSVAPPSSASTIPSNVASSGTQSSVPSITPSPLSSTLTPAVPSITRASPTHPDEQGSSYLPKNQHQSVPVSNSDTLDISLNLSISRESRISLPEEAKRYMAAMGDSPIASPQVKNFGSDSTAVKEDSVIHAVDGNSHTNGVDDSQLDYSGTDGVDSSREFLELGDDASGEDDHESIGGERSVSSTSEREAENDKQTIGSTTALIRKPSADDFPMPPSHRDLYGDPTPTSGLQSHNQYANSDGSNHHSSSLSPKNHDPVTHQFRALPLLATDLPHTKVQVSHSSIRPNDRGKEVLSFVIVVDPGTGKDPWRVEKLYSDVIALDQRVKSMSRSLAKKMPALPESKLWRDHAPAKVDQRKVALEHYLQALILLPPKNKNDVIAFFTSDIVRAKQPVAYAGYKEGYLTKRGKNFGGWKRRYFVLQGSVLEYYESRGGTHLGSINIVGAQIGRQQRSGNAQSGDDDNEYRHAFLIIESKKGPNGSSNRHVLCAESDKERDSWVEILVKYVTGNFQEDLLPSSSSQLYHGSSGLTPIHTSGVGLGGGGPSQDSAQPRSSTSSLAIPDTVGPRKPIRGMSKDDISKGPAVPISQLAPDASNAKLFHTTPIPSLDEAPSPLESIPSSGIGYSHFGAEVPLSSSLPVSSPLEGDHGTLAPIGPRSNSELGHYPDVMEARLPTRHGGGAKVHISPEYQRSKDREKRHTSIQPLKLSSATPKGLTDMRSTSPDPHTPRVDTNGKVKISGPIGGGPLPAGYKFGGAVALKDKESAEQNTQISGDRREKAKSRMFWSFGRPSADKSTPTVVHTPRAVFGVSIEESLDVVAIANLPAIVFRCIQYLEAKKADQEEGIYRLSGSSAVIKSLKDRFNVEGDVDLLASDEYWDPHAIAGLLKTFMRELPSSILTRELHNQFLSVIDFVDAQERIKELSNLIAQLPLANYSLLRALTAHLILIVQNSGTNKMTMRNVGIVFSPTLGIPAGVFSLMLGEFNRVFNVGDEGVGEDDNEDISTRRNSRQYSDTAADLLLGLSGRSLTASTDEQSDEGGDDMSIHDDSGTETTDDFSAMEAPTVGASGADTIRSRMSEIAAKRGLNVGINEQPPLRSGLPTSPRPMNSPRVAQSPRPVPSPSASQMQFSQ